MTDQETSILAKTSEIWNDYLSLEVISPDDTDDVRYHIHCLQRIVLSRAPRMAGFTKRPVRPVVESVYKGIQEERPDTNITFDSYPVPKKEISNGIPLALILLPVAALLILLWYSLHL